MRCYTNFRYINKACLKDTFPLLNIDMIVDFIEGCDILSFMDDFFGYNQIRNNKKDQCKITFITPSGTFY